MSKEIIWPLAPEERKKGTFLMKGKEPNSSFLIFEQNEQTSLERMGFHQMSEPGKRRKSRRLHGLYFKLRNTMTMTTTT